MKPGGLSAQVAKQLGKSERRLARELGLTVAALRSLDGPACPHYVRLALAAMVLDIDPDKVLPTSAASSPPIRSNIAPKHRLNPSDVAHLDRDFDD